MALHSIKNKNLIRPMLEMMWDSHLADIAGAQPPYKPGTPAPLSGIYRCRHCGHEAVSTKENPLPTQSEANHPASCGSIEWELLVAAEHKQ